MTQPNDKERLWAYLDGELAPDEAAQFERTLTEEDKRRLEAERALESGLAARLREGAGCPPALWERLRNDMRAQDEARTPANVRPFRRFAPWAAAAVILLAAGLGIYAAVAGDPTPPFLTPYESVAALRQAADAPGDIAALEAYASEQGYHLSLTPPPSPEVSGHDTKLLGARTETFRGARVLEVLFNCCGEPMMVVVAGEDTKAGQALAAAREAKQVRAFRRANGYAMALVGDHPAEGLINLVNPRATARARYL